MELLPLPNARLLRETLSLTHGERLNTDRPGTILTSLCKRMQVFSVASLSMDQLRPITTMTWVISS